MDDKSTWNPMWSKLSILFIRSLGNYSFLTTFFSLQCVSSEFPRERHVLNLQSYFYFILFYYHVITLSRKHVNVALEIMQRVVCTFMHHPPVFHGHIQQSEALRS